MLEQSVHSKNKLGPFMMLLSELQNSTPERLQVKSSTAVARAKQGTPGQAAHTAHRLLSCAGCSTAAAGTHCTGAAAGTHTLHGCCSWCTDTAWVLQLAHCTGAAAGTRIELDQGLVSDGLSPHTEVKTSQ